ncbi:MAG: hypothetical protein GYB53_24560 [Rhodobacteraceae bacterium]|nr:hypothetical protein [Paracoccaceae bacterium]
MKRFEQVQRLARSGTPVVDIAVLTGLSQRCVTGLIRDANAEGLCPPAFHGTQVPGRPPRIQVSRRVLEELSSYASARQMTECQLANRLLELVLFDNLVDAILGDGGRHA